MREGRLGGEMGRRGEGRGDVCSGGDGGEREVGGRWVGGLVGWEKFLSYL